MQYVIGVDIGTSGTKAVALSVEGEQIYSSTISYAPVAGLPAGWHELDPQVLLNAFFTTTQEVIQHCSQHELGAIGFSTAMHGLICMGYDGKPLSNMITWADQRSIEQVNQLHEKGLAAELHRITGTPVHAMSPFSKLLWLKEKQPVLFGRSTHFIGIKEFIFHELFGEYVIDPSLASATGLYDIHGMKWSDVALDLVGIDQSRLAKVVGITEQFSGLSNYHLARLGLKKDVPFVIGSSDGVLANIGSNCTREGEVSVTIGTSGAARIVLPYSKYSYSHATFCYRLDEEKVVVGGPINNGGILLKWYAEKFLGKTVQTSLDFEWFLDEAMKAKAGAEGLIFLPYLYGERAPVWDASARGAFIGITNGHGQPQFMRAIIEGICYPLKQVISSMEQSGVNIENVCASGGFTRSSSWVQILSDILDKKILVRQEVDASAMGAAIIAMQSIGLISNYDFFHKVSSAETLYQPDLARAELYKEYYEVFVILYPLLKQILHKLHSLQF